MKYFFYSVLVMCLVCSCKASTKPGTPSILPRDKTIQPQNAFTALTLDSMAVASFADKELSDDSLKNKLTSFYNARNYQFAWFTEDGLSEAGQAFWYLIQNSHSKDSSNDKFSLHSAMQRLLNDEELQLPIQDIQQIELKLTIYFFKSVRAAFAGKAEPEDMQWHIPKRKVNAAALLDSFLNSKGKKIQPLNASFYKLQSKLKVYGEVVKSGGWKTIVFKTKTLRQGQSSALVKELKIRLRASGDFINTDTGSFFSTELAHAVKKAQRRFGLEENGIVNYELVKQLNVPAQERIEQMMINMERMRWMPIPQPNQIVANIPEFKLYVYEKDREVLQMNIVVGKAANRTVIFSDELQYIVFSPYWNVPHSIVKNEILPAMGRSKNYIQRNNMEITGYSDGLPIVRQKPGNGNALGRVKFIFPNQYNIYFHDTPAKTLFSKRKRAFSHGCVRLQQPFTLAKYLLRKDSSWSSEKIRKAMNSSKEQWVKLPNPIPVYILYLTAWVDQEGELNFRNDVYGHDKKMASRIFTRTKQ